MTRTLFACALLGALLPCGPAAAQTAAPWPAKPIRMIVPFGAGSPPDVVARLFSRSLGNTLGQPVVTESRLGAGGIIAAEFVAKAPADGYTLMLGSPATLAVAPALYPNLGYRPERDFAPLFHAVNAPAFIVVHPSLGVASVKELVALAKSKPGQLTYGSTGNGTLLHIAGEMFRTTTGTDILHVPYKETGPLNNDFLAGRVQVMFQQLPLLVQHIREGRLKPLAVAAPKRDARLPDVSSAVEAGIPSFEVSAWFGFVAPRGTAGDQIQRINAEMQKALAQADVHATLSKLGMDPVGGPAERFGAYIASETAKWSSVVKTSKIKLD